MEIAPGTRLTIWWPTPTAAEVFGTGAFASAVGHGFTVNVSDDQYRALLCSAMVDADGEGVTLAFEITGRYGDTMAEPSDEDRIREAMAEAQDHPGRTITR